MRKLFEVADRYVETSDWKIIAVLKFCLISLGVILGMEVKEKSRKPVFIAAVSVFIATYIPLMTRFVRIFRLYSQISDANAGKQSASRRLNLREALLKFLEKAAK